MACWAAASISGYPEEPATEADWTLPSAPTTMDKVTEPLMPLPCREGGKAGGAAATTCGGVAGFMALPLPGAEPSPPPPVPPFSVWPWPEPLPSALPFSWESLLAWLSWFGAGVWSCFCSSSCFLSSGGTSLSVGMEISTDGAGADGAGALSPPAAGAAAPDAS